MHESTRIHTEDVSFGDGDYLIIGASGRGNVTTTGRLGGEPVTAILNHRDANYQASLLCSYAPDALWQLPWDRMERIGNALHAASVIAAFTAPADEAEADEGHEEISTRTIPLDGGTAIVEHINGRAELTIRLGNRIICALVLSSSEADQIGMALARPGGFTVGDYWDMCDQLGTSQPA